MAAICPRWGCLKKRGGWRWEGSLKKPDVIRSPRNMTYIGILIELLVSAFFFLILKSARLCLRFVSAFWCDFLLILTALYLVSGNQYMAIGLSTSAVQI